MLKLYGWRICPHCHKAVAWLQDHGVPFQYLEIEEQSPEIIEKVIQVNGGDDWVVPTLEYNGKWHPGQAFNAADFAAVLRNWDLIP